MALTTCFECGREISELAAACPGCGAPGPAALTSGVADPRSASPPSVPGSPAVASPESPSAPPHDASPDRSDPSEPSGLSLEEIRAQWRAERGVADPTGHESSETGHAGSGASRPNPFGFGQSVGEKWSARGVLYIVVGITLVAAIIKPALATVAILAGVAYWTGNKLLASGGRAAEAPVGSGFRTAHEFWEQIGIVGRLAVALVVGLLLGWLTGTL